jgi:MerR family transcriptional regulator, light-induced transcriptional regulator
MTQSHNEFTPNEEPLFNIGAVSRMTHIPETTLRMWERRYNFPKSTRTAGGHRLFSQQEVVRLEWVKQRLDEGMQVSQAIRALEQPHQKKTVPPHVPATTTSDPPDIFRQRLVELLLRHDIEGANQVLGEALILFSIELLILDIIGPTFSDIGEAWSKGQIDIATEHLATNFLRQRLLLWMQTGPPTYQVNPVVLACAPGELHEGGLLMLAVLLRRLRWPVLYLGQTMPLSELAGFVERMEAAALVFVAMSEETARALIDWPYWLPRAAENNKPVVGYGGRIFLEKPELVEQIPGVFLGKTLQDGIEALDRMLHELNHLFR